MPDASAPCSQCEVVARRREPPGGIVLETGHFLVHAVMAPSPIRGWLVLAARRHVGWWWELDPAELAEVGGLAARVFRAQREALGAEHGYALALGDVLHHMHLHLIPRFADTPDRLRGRAAWEGRAGDMLPEAELARAAREVAAVLAR